MFPLSTTKQVQKCQENNFPTDSRIFEVEDSAQVIGSEKNGFLGRT
jgi:hypothetical protein